MSKYFILKNNHNINLSAFRAVLIMALLIAAIVYGIAVCRPVTLLSDAEGQQRDSAVKLYQTVVEQIHQGKSYYSVVGCELHRIGYPTSSVFNWRLPALAWFLGQLPSFRAGQILAFILSTATLLIWMMVFHQNQYVLWQIFLGGFILTAPLMYAIIPYTFLFHEFWAGTLIALSLAAHARGWRYTSVAAGLLALFLRELSLPFVFVMMMMAYMEGRRKESLIWFIGILAFGVELLIHWTIVSKLITENDNVLQGGWIVFGGWPFVLNTTQMHPFLIALPPWTVAIILPLALLGLAWWPGALGLRLACTVGIYVAAFLIVGRSHNIAWGLMYAFLMPLGLLHLPYAFRDLWQPFKRHI